MAETGYVFRTQYVCVNGGDSSVAQYNEVLNSVFIMKSIKLKYWVLNNVKLLRS